MELRQLRYFAKVAELQSFSEASRQLYITQSTLSQQVRQLEDELGVELLVRDSRHVSLTDVGEAFLPQVEKTLKDAALCLDRIQEVQQLGSGEISIGCTHSFKPLLKETILQFQKQYPGVKLTVFCQPMETLVKMLENDDIDIALSYKPTQDNPELETHVLFETRLAVVVSEKHPLAQYNSTRLPDLEKYPFAQPAKGLQARSVFERITDGMNYNFQYRMELNDVPMLIDIVRGSSSLFTVLAQPAASRIPGIKVLSLDQPGTQMQGSIHVSRNNYMKRTTKEFLKMLSENRSYSMALMDMF